MIKGLRLLLFRAAADRRMRYLTVGGINTLWGYFIFLGLYYSLSPSLHIVTISILATILGITVSFLTYKMLVFRTKGNWVREYARCYVVYGGSGLFGIGGIWLLVDGLRIPFWLAQGGLLIAITVFSYVGHSRFSFASAKKVTEEKALPAPLTEERHDT